MEINVDHKSLFAEPKLLHSVKAEQGAERLLESIENEKMFMEVLPNSSEQFSGEREERDYISYCQFLESVNGKQVLQMLEEEDAKECVKLY